MDDWCGGEAALAAASPPTMMEFCGKGLVGYGNQIAAEAGLVLRLGLGHGEYQFAAGGNWHVRHAVDWIGTSAADLDG